MPSKLHWFSTLWCGCDLSVILLTCYGSITWLGGLWDSGLEHHVMGLLLMARSWSLHRQHHRLRIESRHCDFAFLSGIYLHLCMLLDIKRVIRATDHLDLFFRGHLLKSFSAVAELRGVGIVWHLKRQISFELIVQDSLIHGHLRLPRALALIHRLLWLESTFLTILHILGQLFRLFSWCSSTATLRLFPSFAPRWTDIFCFLLRWIDWIQIWVWMRLLNHLLALIRLRDIIR